MLALYAVGFVIYYTHFPESLFPGKFDIWVRMRRFVVSSCLILAAFSFRSCTATSSGTCACSLLPTAGS
jgi:hypothetical protein